MADEIVSHAFSHGFHPQHTERLAAYWAEALGGPTTYSDTYGNETSVVRIHSGNGPHEEMDRRAIACFDQALEDVGPHRRPSPARVARLLRMDHQHDHVALPQVCRRCAAGLDHSQMVVGRIAALIACVPNEVPPTTRLLIA